ncbi:MAG: hypothetical protein KDE68_12220 [Rhodocyclaceae bacterium]|nr:hypothetical protein [Rhodocyclaceae bacterium]
MTRIARPILAALICLACLPAVTHAIGFGEVVSQSAIGEPFRAEIQLHGVRPGEDAGCLRITPGASTDGIPNLSNARVSIRQTNGGSRAVVTHSAPVSDPILRLTLQETCSAQLRRTYTLLLPMRAEIVAPTTSAPAPRIDPPGRTLGRDALGGTWTLTEAASLNTLARGLYPDSRRDRTAFVKATRQANASDPGIRSARQRLAAGTTLALPTPADIETARAELREQQHRAAKQQSPTPEPPPARPSQPAPAPEPPPPPEPATAPTPTRGDRLQLFGDSPEVSGFHLTPRLSDPGRVERTTDAERDALRREQRLVLMLDSQIMAGLELSDRIERLEALQTTLRAELASIGVTPAALPTLPPAPAVTPASPAPAPPPAAPSAPEAPADSPVTWLPVVLGLIATVLGLLWWRRRQAEAPEPDALDTLAGLKPQEEDAADEPIAFEARHPPAVDDASPPGLSDSFDFSPPEWDGTPPTDLEHSVSQITIDEDELTEEHASAVELADIMMSFGRVQGAAETLSDFIRANPKQAIQPWLKLLEVYRAAGMQAEFDGLTRQLNKTFNAKVIAWDQFEQTTQSTDSVEQMTHITQTLTEIWLTRDCQAYIHGLLRDNRDGTREGFPFGVIDDLLMLLAVLEDQLGPYRLTDDEQAAAMTLTATAVDSAFDGADIEYVAPEHDTPKTEAIDLDSPATQTFLPDIDFHLDSSPTPADDDLPDIDPEDTPADRRPDSTR